MCRKMMFNLAVIVLCANGYLGYTPFRLTDCTSSPNRVVTVSGRLLDHPVRIPGHVRAPTTVVIHRPVKSGIRLDVTVEKFIFIDYFALPCVSRVGSCSYDACELLGRFDNKCPGQLRDSSFPCTCPFRDGEYSLQAFPFNVPNVRGPWSFLAYGDFRVTGRLVNITSGEEVNCYSVEFTVQSAAISSPWSLWGW